MWQSMPGGWIALLSEGAGNEWQASFRHGSRGKGGPLTIFLNAFNLQENPLFECQSTSFLDRISYCMTSYTNKKVERAAASLLQLG